MIRLYRCPDYEACTANFRTVNDGKRAVFYCDNCIGVRAYEKGYQDGVEDGLKEGVNNDQTRDS